MSLWPPRKTIKHLHPEWSSHLYQWEETDQYIQIHSKVPIFRTAFLTLDLNCSTLARSITHRHLPETQSLALAVHDLPPKHLNDFAFNFDLVAPPHGDACDAASEQGANSWRRMLSLSLERFETDKISAKQLV